MFGCALLLHRGFDERNEASTDEKCGDVGSECCSATKGLRKKTTSSSADEHHCAPTRAKQCIGLAQLVIATRQVGKRGAKRRRDERRKTRDCDLGSKRNPDS